MFRVVSNNKKILSNFTQYTKPSIRSSFRKNDIGGLKILPKLSFSHFSTSASQQQNNYNRHNSNRNNQRADRSVPLAGVLIAAAVTGIVVAEGEKFHHKESGFDVNIFQIKFSNIFHNKISFPLYIVLNKNRKFRFNFRVW